MTNSHRILVVKCESRVPLGRSTRMGQANIRLDVKEIGYEVNTGRKLIQDKVQCWFLCVCVCV